MNFNKRKEAPLDPFKRALTLATRALAADGGVTVAFSTEPLPKSGPGKVLKRELRAPFWADHDTQI